MNLKGKNRKKVFLGILILSLGFTISCEFYHINDPNNGPLLHLSDTIYHPPDSFKIAFPMHAGGGFSQTGIIFDTTALWELKKMNARTGYIRILNGDTDSTLFKMTRTQDKFQFHRETYYIVSAHNNYIEENRNLILFFRKIE